MNPECDAPRLETSRLLLRSWQNSDLEPYALMNADPEVMRYYPKPMTRAESDAAADRIRAHFSRHGFGLWAAEEKSSGDFIGFIGLQVPGFEASFMPCVEIGWRLAQRFWGRGYATEGAKEVLRFAFEELGLKEIVAMTAKLNIRSMKVMERLGMVRDFASDFEHPKIAVGHALREHVLYRVKRGGRRIR